MKILVLGGAGFLGTNLCRFLVREAPHQKIVAVDSLDPEIGSSLQGLQDLGNDFEFIRGDIRDQSFLNTVIPGTEVIFNCAAQTSHPRSLSNPILDAEINCLGNLRVLETVRQLSRDTVVIYPSSTTVIGKTVCDNIDESHPEKPLEIYSANKGVAEKYHEIYYSAHGVKTVVLRFGNLFGPFGKYSPDFGFFNYFLNLAWNQREIQIFGEGHQLRNVMYVEDAAKLMWIAAQNPELYGSFFLATGPFHHTLREIAESIVSEFGRGSVKFIPWPKDRLKIEIGSVHFSASALEKKIGWKASYPLLEGLRAAKMELEKVGI